MKNLKLIIALAFAALTFLPLSAQKNSANLFPAEAQSFEQYKGVWWTKHKDIWTLTSEKAATGEKALKYNCTDLSAVADVKNISIQSGNKKSNTALLNLKPGTYTFSFKVWLPAQGAPKGFTTNIKKPFVKVAWKTKNVATEEWVTLTQEVEITEPVVDANLVVSVSTNPKWGGEGSFYIDDICIKKSK